MLTKRPSTPASCQLARFAGFTNLPCSLCRYTVAVMLPHCGLLTTMRRLMVSGLLGATASRLTSWRIPTTCYPSLSSSGVTKNSYDNGYGSILLT
jgi:hypothetical protein